MKDKFSIEYSRVAIGILICVPALFIGANMPHFCQALSDADMGGIKGGIGVHKCVSSKHGSMAVGIFLGVSEDYCAP